MFQFYIAVNEPQLRQLLANVKNRHSELRRQHVIAVNKTATKTASLLAKTVTKEINVSQKAVKEQISIEKASIKGNRIEARVILRKSDRIPLKEFQARQTAKGVSYKVKRGGGRGFIPGGFIVNAYGRNVYQRPTKKRPTGRRKKGPSPWGVIVKGGKDQGIRVATRIELRRQIQERIRFTGLKASGAIR